MSTVAAEEMQLLSSGACFHGAGSIIMLFLVCHYCALTLTNNFFGEVLEQPLLHINRSRVTKFY